MSVAYEKSSSSSTLPNPTGFLSVLQFPALVTLHQEEILPQREQFRTDETILLP